MADFQNETPGSDITDPKKLREQSPHFPAHLHRHVPEATDTSIIVAWKNKQPIHNEFCEVGTPEELAVKVKEGWLEGGPTLEPAKAKKAKPGTSDDQQ